MTSSTGRRTVAGVSAPPGRTKAQEHLGMGVMAEMGADEGAQFRHLQCLGVEGGRQVSL
ncbi:hypothetical protein LUX33_11520 [Actinomadura madurae]|uniref:hypothetical protein n=1 Tax=Actinomadura madurae TaxID=1993 RepID=UPI0020D23108|nr:hypothetical protein [Actinomadura madurae]MCP9948976.1 hypothetical protein [Actinomadura madurae]